MSFFAPSRPPGGDGAGQEGSRADPSADTSDIVASPLSSSFSSASAIRPPSSRLRRVSPSRSFFYRPRVAAQPPPSCPSCWPYASSTGPTAASLAPAAFCGPWPATRALSEPDSERKTRPSPFQASHLVLSISWLAPPRPRPCHPCHIQNGTLTP